MKSVFISYSHKDQDLRDQLETHLSMLKREGAIDLWHDRRILAGDEVDATIDAALERANVILLLVSPDFLASSYCYDREMKKAMEMHGAGKARVLPVILRPCDWTKAPFAKLRATPTDGKPVRKWADIDEAFLCVTRDIREAVAAMAGSGTSTPKPAPKAPIPTAVDRPRSGNLRVRKIFSDADKDQFLQEGFAYIANYFEATLAELQARNADIKTVFTRVDARSFTSVIYRNGKAQARCRIALSGLMGRTSIIYSHSDSANDNSFNESMSVEDGEQMLFLKPLGISRGGGEKPQLTLEGAAEYYWEMLIAPLQR